VLEHIKHYNKADGYPWTYGISRLLERFSSSGKHLTLTLPWSTSSCFPASSHSLKIACSISILETQHSKLTCHRVRYMVTEEATVEYLEPRYAVHATLAWLGTGFTGYWYVHSTYSTVQGSRKFDLYRYAYSRPTVLFTLRKIDH